MKSQPLKKEIRLVKSLDDLPRHIRALAIKTAASEMSLAAAFSRFQAALMEVNRLQYLLVEEHRQQGAMLIEELDLNPEGEYALTGRGVVEIADAGEVNEMTIAQFTMLMTMMSEQEMRALVASAPPPIREVLQEKMLKILANRQDETTVH